MYAPSWDQVIMLEESFGASAPHGNSSPLPKRNPSALAPCLGILPNMPKHALEDYVEPGLPEYLVISFIRYCPRATA